MYVFSNWTYCKKCGGTNLEFWKSRNKYSKSGWKIRNLCRECFREKNNESRKKSGFNHSEKRRLWAKQYREKNRAKIRAYAKIYEPMRRKRIKAERDLKKLQDKRFGIALR